MLYFEQLQKKHFEEHSKNIRTLRISGELFDKFLKYRCEPRFAKVNTEEYNLLMHGLIDKLCEYFYECPNADDNAEPYRYVCNVNTFKALLTSLKENNEPKELIEEISTIIKNTGGYHYDYILIRSNDPTKIDLVGKKSPQENAIKFLRDNIGKHFNHDTFEEFIKTHGDTDRVKPLLFEYQDDELIHKWDDCTYMDIHKAHASALMEMFAGTGVDKAVKRKVDEGARLRKQGDEVGYIETKNIINYADGMFAKHARDKNGRKIKGKYVKLILGCDAHTLYNRTVNITRAKIDKQFKLMCNNNPNAEMIYARTDGLIVQHSNPVVDSDKIGEFGLEFQGTVYSYFCKGVDGVSTGYYIHQYTDKNGKKKFTGTLPVELRKHIDLEKGQVVVYKKTFDELHYVHNELLEIKKEKIHENS